MPVWQKRQLSVQPTWLDTHERAAVGVGDEHHLEIVAVGRSQQPFAGAVGRDLLDHHLRPADDEALGEPGPLRLGDVAHRLERRWRRDCRSGARSAWRAAWPASAPAPPRSSASRIASRDRPTRSTRASAARDGGARHGNRVDMTGDGHRRCHEARLCRAECGGISTGSERIASPTHGVSPPSISTTLPCGSPSATGAPHSGRCSAAGQHARAAPATTCRASRPAGRPPRRPCRRARPAAARRPRHTIRRRAGGRLNRPRRRVDDRPAARRRRRDNSGRSRRRCRSRQPRDRSAPRASRARDARRSPPASAARGRVGEAHRVELRPRRRAAGAAPRPSPRPGRSRRGSAACGATSPCIRAAALNTVSPCRAMNQRAIAQRRRAQAMAAASIAVAAPRSR